MTLGCFLIKLQIAQSGGCGKIALLALEVGMPPCTTLTCQGNDRAEF